MQVKSRRWWKAYFFLFALTTIANVADSVWFLVTDPFEPDEIFNSLYLPFQFAELAAVFGYAYNRAIRPRRVWPVVLVVSVLYSVYCFYVFLPAYPDSNALGFVIVIGTLIVVLDVLCWIAIFRYAYRSDELWSSLPVRNGTS